MRAFRHDRRRGGDGADRRRRAIAGANMASISVILPNYNHAAFLPRRIETILAQTHTDFELLILDDCSPDNSRDVIARYLSDPRVRVSFNETNSGNTFLQWRKGLAETTGDYVWVAESDDAADPTFLEKLARQLDLNPTAGLAVAQSYIIDAQDQVCHEYFDSWRRDDLSTYDLEAFRKDFVMDGREYLRRYMSPWNTLPNASAILFRRAAFDTIGGPQTELAQCGDWMTYAHMLRYHDIACLAEPLNYFRQHAFTVRNRLKGEPFVRETLQVERYIASVVGAPPRAARRKAIDFKAQILMWGYRSDNGSKLAFARMGQTLALAARMNRALWLRTLMILMRETAARLLKRRHQRQDRA
ncbi:glycosyltransferase family 2 protein [Sphingomonas sp. BIUV-7]|uniref:Glycosyltransferase family 2 protein n=1 Tax=Sphingomonas natans TaxID=3063330 RepID=A0ABT8Y6P4_9SPHN|nr:glycosyltransferase family 2 protein [Sphingomonas sp. BIUV-7]MDO6413399.1 glycosyltransferase family 2 protein [Sphingomonas sp. BIUV-7]